MISSIENEYLKVSVKASGAELISIRNKKNNLEYLWQGDPQYWGRRAPVLFPIVGKLKNNSFRAEDQTYQLPQHGFARDYHFEKISSDAQSVVYSLKSSEETLKSYPYEFELRIAYTLINNRLEVKYEVINTGGKQMWFSIGGHPAFNCPLEPQEKFNNYYLEFEHTENADTHLISEGLLNGQTEGSLKNVKKLMLNEQVFAKDALIYKGLKSSYVSLKSDSSSASVTFDFKGFPYLGIWSKPGPFVCIEPWYGHADTTNFEGEIRDKEGILSLKKGQEFSCMYGIEIK
ncbi:MAG: aldose 1-epimerase family protein [Cytophagaceae bacterium]